MASYLSMALRGRRETRLCLALETATGSREVYHAVHPRGILRVRWLGDCSSVQVRVIPE